MLIDIIKNVNSKNLNKRIIKVNIIVVHPVYSIFICIYIRVVVALHFCMFIA